jgi:hypothetical protein
MRLRLWKRHYTTARELRLEYILEIDPQTADFLKKKQVSDLTRKGAAELTWIANNPWVLSAPLDGGAREKYYFSSTAKQSACFMFKVFDSRDEMVGFAMLRLIDGHLTVPYCCSSEGHGDQIFRVIGEHVVELPVDSMTLCRPELKDSMQRLKIPCLARLKRRQAWIIGRGMFSGSSPTELDMQDGDGDCAFC